MSTAPEPVNFEALFEQLSSVSQSILQCEDADIPTLQRLMDERAPLLQALHAVDMLALTPSQKDQFDAWVSQTQATDRLIEARFQRIVAAQVTDLGQMARARQALSAYKFPYTTDASGVENQG